MSDAMNIDNLLNIPAVRQALRQHARETSEAEHCKRQSIITDIRAVEAETATLEKEHAAARNKFEQANTAMQVERGKLGNVIQRQGDATRKYNALLRSLNDYGERAVIDAAVRISCVKSGVEQEIARCESALPNRSSPEQKLRARDKLDDLRRYLPELIHAANALEQMRMAPMSPAEITDQVEAIIAASGIDIKAKAA